MSWKPEVQADASGKWYGNALRFATRKEAERSAHDLSLRWTAVLATRAVESDDLVNYTYANRTLKAVTQNGLRAFDEALRWDDHYFEERTPRGRSQ